MRAAWRELHGQLQRPTFFLSEEWVDSWLAVFGQELNVEIWSVSSADLVIAVGLIVHRNEMRGPIPVRCLYLNTSGEGADSVMVEHNSLLVRRGFEDLAWQELGATLRNRAWDELVLAGGGREVTEQFERLYPNWRQLTCERDSPFVSLELVRNHPVGILGLVSTNTRGQLRRAARVLGDSVSLKFGEAITSTEREIAWSELERLHTALWKSRGQRGAFSQTKWRKFHEHLRTAYPKSTRLFTLRAADKTLAVSYLLQCDGHIAFYQSGVQHQTTDNRQKPGLLLHAMVVDKLAAEGHDEYDFLASDVGEGRYKRSLSTNDRTLYWCTVFRPTSRRRVIGILQSLRRWLPRRP
jgi:hypothetical protein